MNKYKTIIPLLMLMVFATSIVHGQETDSLNRYLRLAAENNPAVKAAFHSYEASLQRVPQMGAYEDPQLEMGFFLEPMDIVGGREMAQFRLMQMFPWFGTKKAARTEAQQMAKMAFEEFREAKDKLFAEVYTQWYILCGLQQKRITGEENKKLLQQLETLALQKFASGRNASGSPKNGGKGPENNKSGPENTFPSGMNMGGAAQSVSSQSSMSSGEMGGMNDGGTSSGMSEVLRIQLEIAETESNIESLLSEMKAEKARFNALLNRPSQSEVVVPDTFLQTFYPVDIETIRQTIKDRNPMLGMIREEGLAYKAKEEMNKKMGYPMFGIGLQYMLIGKTPGNVPAPDDGMSTMSGDTSGSMSGMNGKDMIMPMISLSIPIYRNKYKAAQKESQLQRLANEEKQAAVQNSLEADLYRFKHELDDAQRKINLYRKQSALARSTCELVTKEFATGRSDLSAVISVQRQLIDYQLKETEAIAAYNTVVANLKKITGETSETGETGEQ